MAARAQIEQRVRMDIGIIEYSKRFHGITVTRRVDGSFLLLGTINGRDMSLIIEHQSGKWRVRSDEVFDNLYSILRWFVGGSREETSSLLIMLLDLERLANMSLAHRLDEECRLTDRWRRVTGDSSPAVYQLRKGAANGR